MVYCKVLRKYCVEHEWASNAFAVLGVTQFLATVWVTIEYQRPILGWLFENILVHGPLFALICAANVAVMASSVCLGFSDCGKEGTDCRHAFRGRGTGTKVLPRAWDWIDSLGGKHRHH